MRITLTILLCLLANVADAQYVPKVYVPAPAYPSPPPMVRVQPITEPSYSRQCYGISPLPPAGCTEICVGGQWVANCQR